MSNITSTQPRQPILLKNTIPWVEKYRPTNFDDIVLDPINRKIFKNILEKNYFPNLLFYGPPGTGKTTTIINIINEYQIKYNQKNKGTVIHLNASDERGIDVIRSQIHQFVKSNNFFDKGLKFVILDEVDYMTKNAQQALKYLLQSSCYNVRFCLICNYISKIDESLKNEFICVRFNQLPKDDIYKFIKNISINENLNITDMAIDRIQKNYNSDIRSMINFIQLNQNINNNKFSIWEDKIVTDELWEDINVFINSNVSNSYNFQIDNTMEWKELLNDISIKFNIDKKTILKNYLNYIIRKKPEVLNNDFFIITETIMHSNDSNINHLLEYFILHMRKIKN
jgi:replication factor C subunit 3/5